MASAKLKKYSFISVFGCGLGFSETIPEGLQRVAHTENDSSMLFCLKAGRADLSWFALILMGRVISH